MSPSKYALPRRRVVGFSVFGFVGASSQRRRAESIDFLDQMNPLAEGPCTEPGMREKPGVLGASTGQAVEDRLWFGDGSLILLWIPRLIMRAYGMILPKLRGPQRPPHTQRLRLGVISSNTPMTVIEKLLRRHRAPGGGRSSSGCYWLHTPRRKGAAGLNRRYGGRGKPRQIHALPLRPTSLSAAVLPFWRLVLDGGALFRRDLGVDLPFPAIPSWWLGSLGRLVLADGTNGCFEDCQQLTVRDRHKLRPKQSILLIVYELGGARGAQHGWRDVHAPNMSEIRTKFSRKTLVRPIPLSSAGFGPLTRRHDRRRRRLARRPFH